MTDLKFVGVDVSSGLTEQKQANPDTDALRMSRFKPSGGQSGPFVIEPATQVTADAELLVVEDGIGNQVLRFTANAGVVTGTITGDLTISQNFVATHNSTLGSGTADTTTTFARAWSDNAVDFDYASAITLDPSTSPTFGSDSSVDILIGTGTADPDVTGVTALQGSMLLVTDGTAWVKTGAGDTAWTQFASSVQSTLDGVITGGTPNNDVDIPLADPVIFRDNAAAGFDVQTIDVTAAGTNDALAISMGAGGTGGAAIDIDILGAAQGVTVDASISTNPLMTLTKSGGAGVGLVIDVNAIASGRGVTITHGASGEGISMSDGTSASFYNATSLNPLAAYEVRPTVAAAGNGFNLTLSGGTSGSDLSNNGGDLILVGGNGNTSGVDGDVLIGNLTTTANVTVAPAEAVTVTSGTPAAGSGADGALISINSGAGSDAGGASSSGAGGVLTMDAGTGGDSDGVDASGGGGALTSRAGDGGAGSGSVNPSAGGTNTMRAGSAGAGGATTAGASGGACVILARPGSSAVGTGDGGQGGDVDVTSGAGAAGAGGGNGGSGGGITLTAGDGSTGAIFGSGGNIRLDAGTAGGAGAAAGEIRLATAKQDGDTTPAFKYAEAATISPTGAGTLTSGIALYAVSDDPNNEVTAVAGSLALDDGGKAWVNTDGLNTGWDELLTVASGSPSLEDVITSAGVVDNDVDIALSDPIIFNDAGVDAFDLLTLNRTGVGAGDGFVVNMGPTGEATTGAGIRCIDGSGAVGSPIYITHEATNPSAAIQIDSGQFHTENALRIDQTAPTPLNTSYGLLGIFFGGFGSFAEFNIIGAAPTTVGADGRDIRIETADGADGDGGTAAGAGGGMRYWAGDAGADLGGGGAVGGTVDIRAGAGSGAEAAGSISIGGVNATGILIGSAVGGAQITHDAVPGAAGNPNVLLNTSIAGANSGSYAIGVNTTTLGNLPGIANPDLQATLEEIDSLILSGGTLQSNYVGGNTIAVTTTDGTLDFSNTGASDPTVLMKLLMGATTLGTCVEITMTPGAAGVPLSAGDGTNTVRLELDSIRASQSYTYRTDDSTTADGPDINVETGDGFNNGSGFGGRGGDIAILPGDAGTTSTGLGVRGGAVTAAGGDGGTSPDNQGGSGGAVNIIGGTGASLISGGTFAGGGGTVDVRSGTGGDSFGVLVGAQGGQMICRGGVGGANTGGTGTSGGGGDLVLNGGAAGADGGGTGGAGGSVTIAGGAPTGALAQGTITFDALGSAAPIPFNTAGADADLVGFTATSIIGALNELMALHP